MKTLIATTAIAFSFAASANSEKLDELAELSEELAIVKVFEKYSPCAICILEGYEHPIVENNDFFNERYEFCSSECRGLDKGNLLSFVNACIYTAAQSLQ